MTAEQLNKLAKENYNKYFKEREVIEEEKVDDIMLNSADLKEQIEEAKDKYASLEVLRKQLNSVAKEEYVKHFGEDEELEVSDKKSVEDVHLDLLDESYRLFRLTNELKELKN